MTPERRAVLLILGLAAAGQGLRLLAGQPGAPPGQVQLLAGGTPGTPRAHRDSSLALARPLVLGERIDLDRATAIEITRLPRVGLTLARTIVADRESHGPFGSIEALDRVPGIGPGLLGAIGPHVKFSAAGRLGDSPAPPSPVSETTVASRAAESPSRRAVDLNSAGVAELEKLPFVGPYMAAQIVAYRNRHGPFAAVDSLVRVPGVGPATLAKIRDRVVVQ
jgi:competence ComEA-like helix-hairpin-helix protein